jgi:predicted TIM-barrel fold metal-dependent hydrolase
VDRERCSGFVQAGPEGVVRGITRCTATGDDPRRGGSHEHHAGIEFGTDPYELFRDHVWVSPFFEDDILDLVELVGADRVVFGSDWPHAEGLEEPASFRKEIDFLPDTDVRTIMHDNARSLVTRRPA